MHDIVSFQPIIQVIAITDALESLILFGEEIGEKSGSFVGELEKCQCPVLNADCGVEVKTIKNLSHRHSRTGW